MQLDTGGAYEELPGAVRAFERGTMLYRKIQGLETDELFARLVRTRSSWRSARATTAPTPRSRSSAPW